MVRWAFRHLVCVAAIATMLTGSAAAQTGRVGGTVKDEMGQPIKGATITAENPNASPNSFTATTDDKGRFSIIGLRTGEWSFAVQSPGFIPEGTRMRVQTFGQPNPPLEIRLRKAAAPAPSALGMMAAKDLQQELASADQLYNAQQWDQAITSYRAILARTPALDVINLQIASAYRNKKEYDNAISAYRELLKSDPSNEKAKIGIGMANLEKGDIPAAEATLSKAAEDPNPTREVFYNLGEVKFAKGEIDEAAKCYARASELDPFWGKPLYKLALVQLNKGDKEATLKALQRVIAADPTSTEAAQAKTYIDQLKK